MKRTAFAIVCVSLVLVLAGCNVWNIIWQGIIGKGYYQLTQSSIVNSSSNMTSSPIDLTTLTTSSVIIYKTSASGLYGKLSLVTAPPAGSLVFQFTTYASDGTTKQSSSSYTISSGNNFDLEAGSLTRLERATFSTRRPARSRRTLRLSSI